MRLTCLVFLLALPTVALAHSGRTNAQGCHHDNKHRGYHCHNGGTSSAPPSAIRPSFTPITLPKPITLPSTKPARKNDYSNTQGRPNPYLPQSTAREDSEASLYFTTCEEAISAGHAPMHRGEAGFRLALDLDGNGVACDEATQQQGR